MRDETWNRVAGRSIGVMSLLFAAVGCSTGPGYLAAGPRDDWRIYHLRHTAIVDGQTTLAQLETNLGPPDRTSDDGRTIGYLWDVTRFKDRELKLTSKHGEPEDEGAPDNLVLYPLRDAASGYNWYERETDLTYHSRSRTRRHFLLLGVDEAGMVQWNRRFHRDASSGPLPTLQEAMLTTAR